MPDTDEALSRIEIVDQLIVAVKALKRSAYQHTATRGEGEKTSVSVNRCRICGMMSVGKSFVDHRPNCTMPAVAALLQKLKELDKPEEVVDAVP